MTKFFSKFKISYKYISKIIIELLIDIYLYYTSSFPLLLIIGAYNRIQRRVKYLWFPKGPGRPPVPENIVDLILSMKRSNLLWGSLRISQELRLLGISLHKKTVSKILKECGFTTPTMKHQPPIWEALQDELVDRIHLKDEFSIRYFCNLYVKYYNEIRPHQGIQGERPSNKDITEKNNNLNSIKFEKIKHAHGLFYEFKLAS